MPDPYITTLTASWRDSGYNRLIGCGVKTLSDGDPERGAAFALQAVKLSDRRPEAYILVSQCLVESHEYDLALLNAERAFDRAPKSWEAIKALVVALHCVASFGLAGRASFDASDYHARITKILEYALHIELPPQERAQIYLCFSSHRFDVGDDEGCAEYERLARIEYPAAKLLDFTRACRSLARGEYCRETWESFESRYDDQTRTQRFYSGSRRIPRSRYWDGSELPAGTRLLIDCEGGLGDSVQFLRYLPEIRKAAGPGARIVVAIREALLHLYAGTEGFEFVARQKTGTPDYDVAVPLMSLPLVMGTTLDSIPPPWLPEISAAKRQHARETIGTDGFRIGLVWGASVSWRSYPLRLLKPLAALPGVRLFGLQVGPAAEQLKEVDFEITDLVGDPKTGISDAAAAMLNMDLVISADTMPAHLAGSLGVRTFMPLPRPADWRWLRGRQDSPWYASMRVFQQSQPGDWTAPLVEIVSPH